MNKYIIFVLRVEIHLFGMPNICDECPNSMNSYVHGLAGVRDFVFVPYVLNGQPLTAANRHFWIFDVSTWSHGGIVESTIRAPFSSSSASSSTEVTSEILFRIYYHTNTPEAVLT